MPTDDHSGWPRFSIKALMAATALLAAGLCLCLIAYREGFLSHWALGFALIGSGLMVPFGKAWNGALAGPIVIPAIVLLLAILTKLIASCL